MVEFELHLFQPGGDVGAVWEGSHVDFPAFGVAVWWGVGVGGVWEDVRFVADDEVAGDFGVSDAFGGGGCHGVG